jgi:membrane-associated phospholipid phosphatase
MHDPDPPVHHFQVQVVLTATEEPVIPAAVPSKFPWSRFVAAAVLLLIASLVVDRWAYEHIVYGRVYEEDWGRMLRVMGFWPLWLLASIALVLNDWPRRTAQAVYPGLMRGWLLIASVTASGLAGEILKLVFRRERPRAHGGAYYFRPFTDRPLYSGGLALPSSHAIVAFGAATMLSRLYPRAWPVWYLLAIGCGLTRVMAQAHFVSDVAASALVAWAIAAWLWRRHERRIERSSMTLGALDQVA